MLERKAERKRLTQNGRTEELNVGWNDFSLYLIPDNLRYLQLNKMDVDSDSEMPTAGPSMGKVKHTTLSSALQSMKQSFLYLIMISKSVSKTNTIRYGPVIVLTIYPKTYRYF